MKEIEDNISYIVQTHFPEFYKEQGNTFISFVKEYYEWTQSQNNTSYFSRNLFEFRDIDKTIDEFLVHFKEKYLSSIPLNGNPRFNVKHALDFYRSKGTKEGVELFFNLVYDEADIEVYYPGRDILRASDGEWYVPTFLEVSIDTKTNTFLGRQIYGSASGATAFVEAINRKSVNGKYFDVLYLSNIKGLFQLGEIVTSDGSLANCPKIIGSLTNLTISDAGKDFAVGDIVNIISSVNGKGAKARIDSVSQSTGRVSFTLVDGGTGYRLQAVPIVAEKTMLVENKTSSNSLISDFRGDEIIYQPLNNLVFNSANNTFNINEEIIGSNATTIVATGYLVGKNQKTVTGTVSSNTTSPIVLGSNTAFLSDLANNVFIKFQSNNSFFQISSIANNTYLTLTTNGPLTVANTVTVANGSLLVVPKTGNFTLADRMRANVASNTSALISSFVNATASGVLIGFTNTTIGLANVVNTFTPNTYNYIYGGTSNVHANVSFIGSGSGASFSIGSLTDEETVFLNTDLIGSNNVSNVPYVSISLNALAYGFPKTPGANVSTLLNLALTRGNYQIGTIASLTNINPGNFYNINPIILVRDRELSQFDRRDLHVMISNVTGNFIVGEEITQNFSRPAFTLELSGANSAFVLNESVTQQINATSNVYGEVVSANTTRATLETTGSFINSTMSAAITGTVTANSSNSRVVGVGTTFTTQLAANDFIKFSGNTLLFQVNTISNNTLLTLKTLATNVTANTLTKASNVAVGLSSGKYFFVNTSIANAQLYVSRGTILQTNSAFLNVKRKTFNQSFTPAVQITGTSSSATANVISVTQIANSSLMGNNAIVTATAGIVNGSITALTVINSGFAYEDNELITIQKDGSPYVGSAYVNLINQGKAEGYFKSTRGFLNSDKYLHDGDFYQEYSYQIKSGMSIAEYGDVLKQLLHLAGTKMFGNVVKKTGVDTGVETTYLNIETS